MQKIANKQRERAKLEKDAKGGDKKDEKKLAQARMAMEECDRLIQELEGKLETTFEFKDADGNKLTYEWAEKQGGGLMGMIGLGAKKDGSCLVKVLYNGKVLG
ncbi:unnamed protein product, partial [Amoebophrya sp. A120]|eukprot:GSA120T00023405001.1